VAGDDNGNANKDNAESNKMGEETMVMRESKNVLNEIENDTMPDMLADILGFDDPRKTNRMTVREVSNKEDTPIDDILLSMMQD
jgi:hypothetical protein